jgi:hypothetical protein
MIDSKDNNRSSSITIVVVVVEQVTSEPSMYSARRTPAFLITVRRLVSVKKLSVLLILFIVASATFRPSGVLKLTDRQSFGARIANCPITIGLESAKSTQRGHQKDLKEL